uniref:Uncharacterized protein n=1 Tax=Caenorhabditis japonica TaxID=281687 RepID=A0A8R1DGQ3_CAEJA
MTSTAANALHRTTYHKHDYLQFLFDCELISDWSEDDYENTGVIDEEPASKQQKLVPNKHLPETSISDQAETLLKGGLSKQQLQDNAAIREKEKALETVVRKPGNRN